MMQTFYDYEANILRLCQASGSSWLSYELLAKYFSLDFLKKLEKEKFLVKAYKNNSFYYTLPSICNMEQESVKNIFKLKYANNKIIYKESYINQIIDYLELKLKVKLHPLQRKAVITSVNSSFMVLTGGPGTGKTFTINFIKEVHKILQKNSYVLFAAPSGKAAKRITESIGELAYTVHDLLNITPETKQSHPLPKEVTLLIVDEISLLDIEIFSILVSSIHPGTKVILIGDSNQLPSVNHGSVLRDLITSNVIDKVELEATFRQNGNSKLLENINTIKEGNYNLEAGNDFRLATVPKELSSEDVFLWLYKEKCHKWGIDNVLGLTPFRKTGKICSNNLNYLIQKSIKKYGPSIEIDSIEYHIGDPVLQLVNNNCFSNGEIGYVKEITLSSMSVQFPSHSNLAYYTKKSKNEITLAYCMSTHKSQGSESPAVVTALLPEHKTMANKNILYTAITRAKKEVDLLYEKQTLIYAVQNDITQKRITMLSEFLQYGHSQLVNL